MVESIGSSPVAKIAEQARGATDRVAEKATDAITSARDSVRNSLDSVADRADAATRWASERVDAVKQGPNDLLNAGAEYSRARPYAAVGVALALGTWLAVFEAEAVTHGVDHCRLRQADNRPKRGVLSWSTIDQSVSAKDNEATASR